MSDTARDYIGVNLFPNRGSSGGGGAAADDDVREPAQRTVDYDRYTGGVARSAGQSQRTVQMRSQGKRKTGRASGRS